MSLMNRTFSPIPRSTWAFADDAGGGGGGDAGDPFLEWLATQPTDVQEKFQEHVHGLKSALLKERDKSKGVADLQRRIQEFEAVEAKRKEAEMTELEKAQTAITSERELRMTVENALKKLKQEALVTRVATSLRFADPEDAIKFLTSEQLAGDEGTIKKALIELLSSKKYLEQSKDPTPGSKTKAKKVANEEPADQSPRAPIPSF